ncbi:MAG: VWA domain-containing protein, partial [Polyangiaceae bacterium]
FEERHGRDLDRRTTLVILGDGRTNYHADAVDSLARLKERARAIYWLCPEPRASWAFGDSAMVKYAKHTTKVLEVTCARELEEAARLIAKR